MKTVHLHLEDEKYKRLVKVKGDMNWEDFVMQLASKKGE